MSAGQCTAEREEGGEKEEGDSVCVWGGCCAVLCCVVLCVVGVITGHVLVAAWDRDQTIVPLPAHHSLDAVSNQIPGLQPVALYSDDVIHVEFGSNTSASIEHRTQNVEHRGLPLA